MLISLYMYLKNFFVVDFFSTLLDAVMPIIIIGVGIVMLLGAVGIKFHGSLTTALVDNLFKAIGYVCRQILRGLWILCRAVWRFTPKFYRKVKYFCRSKGATETVSNIVASIVAILFVAIII